MTKPLFLKSFTEDLKVTRLDRTCVLLYLIKVRVSFKLTYLVGNDRYLRDKISIGITCLNFLHCCSELYLNSAVL